MPESGVGIESKPWPGIVHPYWKCIDKWDKSYRLTFSIADLFCCAACNGVRDAVFHLEIYALI